MPDSQSAKNTHDTHVKASTRHTKSGDVVQVQSFDRHFDALGETLKAQGTPVPMVAQPGKFPNGRSVPGTPAVMKAEKARQDSELLAAQKEVEQLKAQLVAVNAPPQNEASPEQPTLPPSYYSYSEGTGTVGEAASSSSSAPA